MKYLERLCSHPASLVVSQKRGENRRREGRKQAVLVLASEPRRSKVCVRGGGGDMAHAECEWHDDDRGSL